MLSVVMSAAVISLQADNREKSIRINKIINGSQHDAYLLFYHTPHEGFLTTKVAKPLYPIERAYVLQKNYVFKAAQHPSLTNLSLNYPADEEWAIHLKLVTQSYIHDLPVKNIELIEITKSGQVNVK
jgi:hypothetical protein